MWAALDSKSRRQVSTLHQYREMSTHQHASARTRVRRLVLSTRLQKELGRVGELLRAGEAAAALQRGLGLWVTNVRDFER